MAVRHGYGKIAGTDALVFAYDTGDTRNSYKGEPTTNLVSNANFSNGTTGWSYVGNGASYFETTTFQGRTVLHGNGVQYYNQTGYIRQAIPVTSGATYTFSMRYYVVAGGLTLDPDDAWNGGGTFTSTGQWLTYTSTFTTTSTSIMLNLYGQNNVSSYYYITDIQIEQKSHVTPFVNGTRSATQGLLDLTGNYTIDITNASFDSNAFITFDGSGDYLDIQNSTSLFSGTQDLTVEAAYSLEGQGGAEILGNYGSGYTTDHLWFSGMYGIWLNGGVYAPGYPLSNGKYHMVGTRESGVMKLYLNGVLVNSGTRAASIATDINYRIGADVNGAAEPFTGDIYVVKAYNRALTADEVRNNFRHYKTRYNI